VPHRRYDAIVLAGGTGKRLGGLDKPGLDVGGATLLNRVLAACSGARSVVVVGNARRTVRQVRWTLEDPPFGGPLAAIEAGLTALPAGSQLVVTLASDLPYLTAAHVERLVDHLAGSMASYDCAAFSDDSAAVQPLAAVYRTDALARTMREIGELRHLPARRALEGLRVTTVPDEGATRDCDTPQQLAAARLALID
jgi:molybdopterin-guanine dinucleotide biosynthesis protein A